MDCPKTPRGYALFDLDQTLIPWDTQLLFCNFVLKRIPLRRLYLLTLVPLLPFYKIIGTDGMKRVFLNYLWGLSQDDLEELAEEFVCEHFPNTFYQETLEFITKQKLLGRTTVLSSASPDIWVKHIAEKLGFDYWFGTQVEINPRVRLFPELIGGNNKGSNKLDKMRHLFPSGFDMANDILPNSCGFSDSHVDLPMLRICETAMTIHPTPALRQVALENSWQVLTPVRPTKNKVQFAISCLRQALGIYST